MLSRFNEKQKLNDYLEQEQHSYPEIFENSPDILLFVVDLKGAIVKVRGGDNFIKEIAKQIVGKDYRDFIFHEDVEKVSECFVKVFGGEAQYIDYRVKDLKGHFNHIDVTLVPIRFENNEIIGLYGLAHNISEKQELIQDIEESHGRLQSLLHHADEIIVILDSDGTIIFESAAIKTVLGYEVGENLGKNYIDIIHPDDQSLMKQKFEENLIRFDATIVVEIQLKHNNGEWRDFKINLTNLLNNPNINGVICNFHDITETKKQQREIQYMAYHDYLTGLPNRRSFEHRLDLEIRLANVDDREFAILLLNIDGFKYINNSLGHEIGDFLLVEVAQKINREFSKEHRNDCKN